MNTETATDTISVVVVDDHPLASTGIAHLLRRDSELDVEAVCFGETESINAVRRVSPQIIVFEFPNPRAGAPGLMRAVASSYPDARVVIVGKHVSEIELFRDSGASAFVTTEQAPRFLVACVRNVHEGATWIEYTGRMRRVSTPPGGQYIIS